jgi:apolipoprotein N-acyltransferase
MRLPLRIAAAGVSAVAFGAAFPPLGAKALAWVALAPLLVALRGARLRTALGLAWGWTLLAAWMVGTWLPDAVATYFLQPRALGYVFFFGVATAMAAVFYMAFAAVYVRLAARLDPRWLPLAVAAAWVAAELGRGRLLTAATFVSLPWGLIGYTQVGVDPVVQVASWTGVYGVSFAIAAANAALAQLALARRDGGAARRRTLGGAALGALPALLVATLGAASLRAAPSAPGSTEVVVVQGDVSLGTRWRSEFYGENLGVYLRATRRALAERPAALVVWPEAALTFFLLEEPAYLDAIARELAARDAELLVGGPRDGGGPAPAFFNSFFLVGRDGRVAAHYDKEVLVPFTEYFPLGGVDFLRRRFERVRVFAHGPPTPPLPTRAGPAGVLTCNEGMMAELAAERVREGAAFLVNPSNDTWAADLRFAEHLFDIVRLRAVEQRRWLVRASTSGPSAIVDPWGRVRARSEPFEPAVVRGRIAPERQITVYARVGDLFAGLCAASLLPWLWLARPPRGAGSGPARAGSAPGRR